MPTGSGYDLSLGKAYLAVALSPDGCYDGYHGSDGTDNLDMGRTCPFCSIAPERIQIEDEHVVAIRDNYPVSKGHTLIVPRLHIASLFEVSREIRYALLKMVEQVRSNLIDEFDPHGFNIGINDGEVAGQTVMHSHIHVIPRYEGDVDDPRGGVRWVIPDKVAYWNDE